MKFGLVIGAFAKRPLPEAFATIREIGYSSVEMGANLLRVQGADLRSGAEKARKLADACGLSFCAVGAMNDFIQPDPEAMTAQVDIVREVVDTCEILGCRVVRVDGGRPKEGVTREQEFALIVEALKQVAEHTERKQVEIALDNHGRVTNDAHFQKRIFDAVRSKRLGACVDTSNYRWFGHDLETVQRFLMMMVPYTKHTHVKDGHGRAGTQHFYTPTALGEGEIDPRPFLTALMENGYRGAICTEYGGREGPVVGFTKNLRYLEAWYEQYRKEHAK